MTKYSRLRFPAYNVAEVDVVSCVRHRRGQHRAGKRSPAHSPCSISQNARDRSSLTINVTELERMPCWRMTGWPSCLCFFESK